MRNGFILIMFALSVCMYLLLVDNIKNGNAFRSALGVWIVSPVLVLFVWVFVQKAQPSASTLTWGNISYAAVVGDIVILPAAAYVVSYGWKMAGAEVPSFFRSGWWLLLAFAVGVAGGRFFHTLGGKSDSSSPILSEQLHDSPLTWTHNVGIFPALMGALIHTILPLVFTASGRGYFWGALSITVVGWGFLQAIDAWRTANLPPTSYWYFNPQWMDVPFNWPKLAPR